MFFQKTNLRHKEGRQFVNADFSESSLAGQDYTEADCRQAKFSKSDLRSAKFRKANLSGAKLNEAKIGLRPCYSFLFIAILLSLSGLSGVVSGYSGASFKIVIDSITDIVQTNQAVNTTISFIYLISILLFLFFSVKNGLICICLLIVTAVFTSFLWVLFIGYWHLASAGAWAYSWVIAIGGFIAIITCETSLWVISRSIYVKILFYLIIFTGMITGAMIPPWAISGGDIISAIYKSGYWCAIWAFGIIFITQYAHKLVAQRKAFFSIFEEVSIGVISKYGTDFHGANLTDTDFTGVNIKNSCFVGITPSETEKISGFRRDNNTFSSFRKNIADELELRRENENLSRELQHIQEAIGKIQKSLERGLITEASVYIKNINKNKNMRDKNAFSKVTGDIMIAHDNATVNNHSFTSQQAKNLYNEIEKIIEQAEGTPEEKEAVQDILKKTGHELEKPKPDNEKVQRYLTIIQKLLPTVAGLPWEKIIQGVKACTGL